ncbi:hypothetical protein KP509_27G043900 [Ceratopteris richardii]|uniref:Reverse transcriptase zinc-binding domain-containing protein n=1 Tax=Ceratopteris richardii TaxID=49495 RepID=A0A8T2RG24_CERRI|nr:hypothetical protein KP509_27G043900 [Ceratopteris richardii]
MFYLLEAKMNSNLIHGISMFGSSHVAVGFADDTFIFAKADAENIHNTLAIDAGIVFRHLGYPLGINVPIKDKIHWVLHKVNAKMELWCASQWPLHVRIKIVHAFLQPCLMYYLLLLDWKKYHLQGFDCLIKNFLWNKKHNRALVLSAWRYQYQIALSIDSSNPWHDWLLGKHTRWWIGKTNTFYHLLLPSDDITLQCNIRWRLQKVPSWWHARFSLLWESSLSFRMKIFMWRICTGHFTLEAFLSKHGLQVARCSHCTSYDESMCHAFWICSYIQRWWNKLFLFPISDMRPSKIGSTFFLFGSGDRVLDWVRKRCISLLLWNIWMLRNKKLFRNNSYVPNFSWTLCKLTLRRDIDVMPAEDKVAFTSFLENI